MTWESKAHGDATQPNRLLLITDLKRLTGYLS